MDRRHDKEAAAAHLNVHLVLALGAENAGLPEGEKRRGLLQESVWTDDVLQVAITRVTKAEKNISFCLPQLHFNETKYADECHHLETQCRVWEANFAQFVSACGLHCHVKSNE